MASSASYAPPGVPRSRRPPAAWRNKKRWRPRWAAMRRRVSRRRPRPLLETTPPSSVRAPPPPESLAVSSPPPKDQTSHSRHQTKPRSAAGPNPGRLRGFLFRRGQRPRAERTARLEQALSRHRSVELNYPVKKRWRRRRLDLQALQDSPRSDQRVVVGTLHPPALRGSGSQLSALNAPRLAYPKAAESPSARSRSAWL